MSYNKNAERVRAAKDFTAIEVSNFKQRYPKLDVSSLSPTIPASLKKVALSNKAMAQIGLPPVVLSVICGTVFGDASLKVQKGYAKARMSYRHSTRQTDWFMWKTFCPLAQFTSASKAAEENKIQFQLPDGFQVVAAALDNECLGKWRIDTAVDEKLTQLHDIICPNGKKTIKRNWLNHMNDYFLMTLWLDDGGLATDLGCQGGIATGTMPLEQAKILAEYIQNVWGVDCKAVELKSQKNNPTRIYIANQDALQAFLRIVTPIIPVKSMLYKVCFFANDVSLQQRWASELKELVRPEWHTEIDKIYLYKTIKFLSK